MDPDETPYTQARDEIYNHMMRLLDDLKMQRSIARASEKGGGKGHLRPSGRYITVKELSHEIRIIQHMIDHTHDSHECGYVLP